MPLTSSAIDRRFDNLVRIPPEERTLLASLSVNGVKSARAREDLIHEDDPAPGVYLILEGWAARYKTLEDGRRQIAALVLPGDICNFNMHLLGRTDHSVAALTPMRYLELSPEALDAALARAPRLARLLHRDALVAIAVQREWTINLGQRSATERIAHLICEIYHRLRAIGQTLGTTFFVPLTQNELAETTGMSAVHVNRVVQDLRAQGLITWKERMIDIRQVEALARVAGFNPGYLYLDDSAAA